MQEIIIDEEFRSLLPELDKETYRLLVENLLEHGCRDPLVLWKGILVDGYNRYRICSAHGIPFNTVEKDFESREEALIWIISNQVSRRNLSPLQLSHYRGLHYKADKKIQGTNNQYASKSEKGQNDPFRSGSTAGRLAGKYKVSPKTIKRDVKLAEGLNLIGEISPEAKRKILSGKVTIDKGKLQVLHMAPKEEIEAMAADIDAGTYKRRAAQSAGKAQTDIFEAILPELKELNLIIRDFSNNFNSMLRELANGDPAELEPVLRSFIDKLVDLYVSMYNR